MKRLLIGLMVAAVAAIGFGSVAASASATRLQTFGTGTVTVGDDGTSATIVNGLGEYGGVYINSKSKSGKPLNAVDFSFVSTGFVTGGAPRFSIPIDTDGVGSTNDGYAFIDAQGCGGAPGETTTVSTALDNCQVSFNSPNYNYANWAAFAAANPTYRIAPGFIPFIIADEPGSYAVNSIDLR
jgi:opacity protein-like surface antigen